MTGFQQAITIALVVVGTQLTRWIPFLAFGSNKKTPAYVRYIGKVLPPAIFGMLVIYCFKDLDVWKGTHGIPEIVSGCCVAALQLLFRNMGLSIFAGTLIYIIWINGCPV